MCRSYLEIRNSISYITSDKRIMTIRFFVPLAQRSSHVPRVGSVDDPRFNTDWRLVEAEDRRTKEMEVTARSTSRFIWIIIRLMFIAPRLPRSPFRPSLKRICCILTKRWSLPCRFAPRVVLGNLKTCKFRYMTYHRFLRYSFFEENVRAKR